MPRKRNVYSQALGVGGPLTAYRGFLTGIATGGPFLTLAVLHANVTTAYHFLDFTPEVTVTTSGYTDCAQFFPATGHCPTGSVHTATAGAAFDAGGLHGANGVTAASSGAPANVLTALATGRSVGCDLIFGDPNAPECRVSSSSLGKLRHSTTPVVP